MLKRCLLGITVILCMIFCLSACQTTEPVDNNLTGKTPTPSIKETPGNTDATATTGGMQTQTQGQTQTPIETPTETPTETPSATVSQPTAGTSTETTKPNVTPGSTTAKPTATNKPGGYTQPYVLYVNRKQNVVTVYTADSKGNAVKPIKAMLCSTGRNNSTPTGSFSITEKYLWRPLNGGVYGQYACRFNGSILFHSVPYVKKSKDALKPGEYNKLGSQASDGCVRLAVQDCKWIYDNCAPGTKVVVYASNDPEPLARPTSLTIPYDAGWDPTDPDVNNPWKTEIPAMPVTFSGIPATTVELQRNAMLPDLSAGVTAKDSIGRDATSYIKVSHALNMKQTGIYKVTYQVTRASDNKSTTAVATYQVVDKTAPVIQGLTTIHYAKEADVLKMTQDVLLQGVSISDDGDKIAVSNVYLTIKGQPYAPELLKAGAENEIVLQVADENGNVAKKTVKVVVETTTTTPDVTEAPTPTPTTTPTTTSTPTSTPTSEATGTADVTITPKKNKK